MGFGCIGGHLIKVFEVSKVGGFFRVPSPRDF